MGDSGVPEPIALKRFRRLCSALLKSAEEVGARIQCESACYVPSEATGDAEVFLGIVRRAFDAVERTLRNLERLLGEVWSLDLEDDKDSVDVQLEAKATLILEVVDELKSARRRLWLLRPPTVAHGRVRESAIGVVDAVLREFVRFASDCSLALQLAEESVAGETSGAPSHGSLVFHPDMSGAMAEFEQASRQFQAAHSSDAGENRRSAQGGEPMNPVFVFLLVLVMGLFCLLIVR